MRKLLLILSLLLAFSACGRKEAPQPVVEDMGPPEIVALSHQQNGNIISLDFTLQGGKGGIGYQIERAEMDPYCKCPGMWRMYFEQPTLASQQGKAMSHLLPLKKIDVEFAFRIRAVDAIGRLSPWSETITGIYRKPE